jgi:hypothetical protein
VADYALFIGWGSLVRDQRLGMVEGVELLAGHGAWSKLSSVRRHGDYLFMRYRTRPA